MEVDDRLLTLAQQLQRSYGPAVLTMRVASELPVAQVRARACEAVEELAGDEVHWSVDEEPSGVIVRQWGYTPDIGETLHALARGLADLDGRLVAHQPPPTAEATRPDEREVELLECHLRTFGERWLWAQDWELEQLKSHGREPDYRVFFTADVPALLAGVQAALSWVGSPPPGARLWSTQGMHPGIEEVRAHVASGFWGDSAPWSHVTPWEWWWESGDAFRLGRIYPARGDVSLVSGGVRFAGGEWAPAHRAMVDELRAASSWASYGLIVRGRRVSRIGCSPHHDWVPAAHIDPTDLSHSVYEDVLAPDAFGVQLLGAGYAGRVPDGDDWERVELAGEAVLLQHRDPAAWFAHGVPPTGTDDVLRSPSSTTCEVIVKAREALAGILLTRDVLRAPTRDPLAGR